MKPGIDYIGVGCGAVIIKDNKILLMKRTEKCTNMAGYWTIPGGKVKFNETFKEALKREIKEELGIEIEVLQLLSLTNDIILNEKQHWVTPQFLCKIKSGTVENREPHKCSEVKWFDPKNTPEKITKTTKNALAALKTNI